jgi:hypothetical protein
LDIVEVRLKSVESTNLDMKLEMKKLSDILITLGKYEERFQRVEGMVDDLRRGRGFISKD